MGAIEAAPLGVRFPRGAGLFNDVAFRVGDGDKVALVGANGAGKTTLVRLIAGDEVGATGVLTVDGRLGVMRQFIGSIRDRTTVRDLLVSIASPSVRAAAARLAAAERANDAEPSAETGMKVAEAWGAWADAGGAEAEVLWDTCATAALRKPLADVGERLVSTLSGGEQKRLALEALLRGTDDVLLLDEPDNYLDVPGKEWLEDRIPGTKKNELFVRPDPQPLGRPATKVLTPEGTRRG